MNVRDIFKKDTYSLIFNRFGSLPFATSDVDWKTTDDLDIVLNKLSKAFVSGSLVVLDEAGKVKENTDIPIQVSKPNLLIPDYIPLFFRYLYLLKKYGIVWIYFRKSSYMLLENANCEIDFNTKGLLNVTNFQELIKKFKYSENGKTYDLLQGEGELVPIFDIGFSHNDYMAISRSSQIKETLKVSNQGIQALQGAFRRISMMLLAPENDSNGVNMVRVSNMNDKEVVKDNDKFNKMFSIKENAISVLNKSYKVLDTNPDNRKLDAPNSLNFAAERICNQYDYPYKLFRGETKFDDAEFIFSTLYMQTLQPEADKLLKVICENMRVKERVRMDYTRILEQTVSTFKKSDNESKLTSTDSNNNEEFKKQ
jgi:hypothetical protein